MSVQYKESGTWKNISSSSNNAVDTVADGNMNPVTSNAVHDALPVQSTSTSIKMTMTNVTEGVTGTAVDTRIIKLGTNWGIVIGIPYVSCTTSGIVQCSVAITGASFIANISIEGWQDLNTGAGVGYNERLGDFWLINCVGNNNIRARIVALVSW